MPKHTLKTFKNEAKLVYHTVGEDRPEKRRLLLASRVTVMEKKFNPSVYDQRYDYTKSHHTDLATAIYTS